MKRRGFLGALCALPVAAGAAVLASKKKSVLHMAEYTWGVDKHTPVYVHVSALELKMAEAERKMREALENDLYMADGPHAYYSGYDVLKL